MTRDKADLFDENNLSIPAGPLNTAPPEDLEDLVRIGGALGKVLALVDHVARLHRTADGGRARQDDVAGHQCDEPRDVGHRVAGVGAGAEVRAADVDGVGTMVDRLDADVGVARRGEQFQLVVRHVDGA